MKNPFSKKNVAKYKIRNEIEKTSIPVHDIGAIGLQGISEERLIPTIIADLSARPDLVELIRIHENSGPGDHKMQWGIAEASDCVRLIIEFHRPLECLAIFDFSISKFGVAVDSIFRHRALYLQGGSVDTKISRNPNAPKIYCEIPSTGIEREWEKAYKKVIFKKFREQGMSRTDAKNAAKEFITQNRVLDKSFSKALRRKGKGPDSDPKQ